MCSESSRRTGAVADSGVHLDVGRLRESRDEENREKEREEERRREREPADREDVASSVIERVTRAAHRNYRALAYSVVIGTYVLGFTEYVYLRLSVLVCGPAGSVAPAPSGESGKDGLHYAIAVAAFFAIGIFQIICFFGLTISERLLVTVGARNAAGAAGQQHLAATVRILISRTIERTFLCYAVCSLIVCMIIFYMLGIQDSANLTASTICVYLFDGFVIVYFICFPLITILYHPHMHCRKDDRLRPLGTSVLPAPSSPVHFDSVVPMNSGLVDGEGEDWTDLSVSPSSSLPQQHSLSQHLSLPSSSSIRRISSSARSSPPFTRSSRPIQNGRHSAPARSYRTVTTV